jgi:hypothetical protein
MQRTTIRAAGALAAGALATALAAGTSTARAQTGQVMTSGRVSASAAGTASGTAEGAGSSTAASSSLPRFEITPYGGYRFGGEFQARSDDDPATPEVPDFELHEGNALGVIFNIRTQAVNTQWEILYGHQQTEVDTLPTFVGGPRLDLDVDYLQYGGSYLFDELSTRTVPFISMTAGIARFDPSGAGMDAETYFSGSLGGGVQLRADKRVGVRLEARGFASLIDSNSALFCQTGPEANRCALSVSGTALYQFEARAGIVIRF